MDATQRAVIDARNKIGQTFFDMLIADECKLPVHRIRQKAQGRERKRKQKEAGQ